MLKSALPSFLRHGALGWISVHVTTVCTLVALLTAVFAGASTAYYLASRRSILEAHVLHAENLRLRREIAARRGRACLPCLAEARDVAHREGVWRQAGVGGSRSRFRDSARTKDDAIYKAITGSTGHELPKMYGKVREKTIWTFWYDPVRCPTSEECVLPPVAQLCTETVGRHRGHFDYKVVHMDEVPRYVNQMELPLRWQGLPFPLQRDSLMNALLARYGGVALDIFTVLLRPLDDHWGEMVARGASFWGYMYRINGDPWRHAEVAATWFMMSRREGVFSTAVRNQVIGMGDEASPREYPRRYSALGDQTLLPVLSMFNYTLPKCFDDPTLALPAWHADRQFRDQSARRCPENGQPPWYRGITGPARSDTRIMLRDPRDGPQLPFAFEGMLAWDVSGDAEQKFARSAGSPMQGTNCSTPRECWERVFLQRFRARGGPGEAPLLSFVRLFHQGSELEGQGRAAILSQRHTYFYHWLKLAGVVPG